MAHLVAELVGKVKKRKCGYKNEESVIKGYGLLD
jgi:hypothetical protein